MFYVHYNITSKFYNDAFPNCHG